MSEVVITGLGLFSPLGVGRDVTAPLLAGETGIRPVERFNCAATPGNIGAELRGWDEGQAKKTWLKPVRKSIKVMCREIQVGVASAAAALEDADILGKIEPERLGIDFGANLMLTPPPEFAAPAHASKDESGQFDFDAWGTRGYNVMEPLWLLKYLPNMPACHIGILADARGPNNSLTQDEASAYLVMGEARRVLQRGWADAMICGATGTRVHEMKSIHAAMWDKLGFDPADLSESCRPFDVERNGEVVGEGAATFILETAEHAAARGAKVLAKLLGTSAVCVTDPKNGPDTRRALTLAMNAALKDAGLSADDISYVNAHGAGSVDADAAEAAALRDVLGDRPVPVTALKSVFGNAGASCGAIELAATLLAAEQRKMPATQGTETVDPALNVNVVKQTSDLPGRLVLSTAVTRLGQASAVVVELP